MQIRLPRLDGTLETLTLKAQPLRSDGPAKPFNRVVYAAAHVVVDPFALADPWDASPVVDWDATLAFREHLYRLGFRVAEAMDTAQRGMGVDWPVSRELIQRSLRHALIDDQEGEPCAVVGGHALQVEAPGKRREPQQRDHPDPRLRPAPWRRVLAQPIRVRHAQD